MFLTRSTFAHLCVQDFTMQTAVQLTHIQTELSDFGQPPVTLRITVIQQPVSTGLSISHLLCLKDISHTWEISRSSWSTKEVTGWQPNTIHIEARLPLVLAIYVYGNLEMNARGGMRLTTEYKSLSCHISTCRHNKHH